MFLHLSKLLWSIAGLVLGSIVFVGAARAVSRRGEALALAVVLAASASLAALTLPPVADALEGRVAASGRTTMRPAIEYDVAIVLSGTPLRASAAAEVVRSGRARYLLHSGMLDEAEIADLTSQLAARGVPLDRLLFETRSRNTRENAVESSRIVAARGWRSVLLVTSAAHVERAVACFHRLGVSPDALAVRDEETPRGSPSRRVAWQRSKDALHEIIGRLVYRVLGYSD